MVKTQLYQLWDANEAWAYAYQEQIRADPQYQDYDYDDNIAVPSYPSDGPSYDDPIADSNQGEDWLDFSTFVFRCSN